MKKKIKRPKIRLSRLRDIGWYSWDPIGLLPAGGKWDDEDNLNFADEYDTYLMYAAGQLRRGTPDAEVVANLVMIEAEHMGLGIRPDTQERAKAVVASIHADDQLWT